MLVSKDTRLEELQDQFMRFFPYLKIAVYKHEHHDHEGSPKTDEISMSAKIGDLNPIFESCEIHFDGAMKVSEFENMMNQLLGINIQVFRKSNDLWLQTSKTDDWTLEKQNSKGYRSSLNLYPETDTDYDADRH